MEKGIFPSAAAGFSLGEYAAMKIAGVINTEECFSLVKERGKLMQEASDSMAGDGEGGMAAVIGLEAKQVEALVAKWTGAGLEDLYCANFNSPSQTVISGTAFALNEAKERFKQAGAKRVIPLKVAGPFHSPLMQEAEERFRRTLEEIHFNDPLIPLYSNVSGERVFSGTQAKSLALKHITSPVLWVMEEKAIAGAGIDRVLESGPGNALCRMWKESGLFIPCYAAGTVKDIETILGENKCD